MNKTRRKKSRRKARKRKHLAQLATHRMAGLEVSEMEIARGHDGFLRGSPEPVLVCALFSLLEGRAKLTARGIGRFDNPPSYPCVVKSPEPQLAQGKRPGDHKEPLAILIVAMEEDSGDDIQRLYAALEDEEHLQLLETSGEPRALYLEDVLQNAGDWAQPYEVDLLLDGESFAPSCTKDTWVAAGVFTATHSSSRRVHLVSEDKQNDWTAIVHLR